MAFKIFEVIFLKEENGQLFYQWRVDTGKIVDYYDFDWSTFFQGRANVVLNQELNEFLFDFNLDIGEVRGDGLCFIHCLKWFLAEAFDLRPTIGNFKERIMTHILHDDLIQQIVSEETGGSMTDRAREIRASRIVEDYFDNRNFDTFVCDLIINRIPNWFNINVVTISPLRNSEVEVKWNRTDDAFDIGLQSFNGLFMVVLRTGEGGGAHYRFLLNKNKIQKYVMNLRTGELDVSRSAIVIEAQAAKCSKDISDVEDDDNCKDEVEDDDVNSEIEDLVEEDGNDDTNYGDSLVDQSNVNNLSLFDEVEIDNYDYRRGN